jgi:hypothetical protein
MNLIRKIRCFFQPSACDPPRSERDTLADASLSRLLRNPGDQGADLGNLALGRDDQSPRNPPNPAPRRNDGWL